VMVKFTSITSGLLITTAGAVSQVLQSMMGVRNKTHINLCVSTKGLNSDFKQTSALAFDVYRRSDAFSPLHSLSEYLLGYLLPYGREWNLN